MKEFKCEFCKFCTKQDKLNQLGLCTEEHSPANARGERQKAVHLWSLGCRFRSPIDAPKLKPQKVKWQQK